MKTFVLILLILSVSSCTFKEKVYRQKVMEESLERKPIYYEQ